MADDTYRQTAFGEIVELSRVRCECCHRQIDKGTRRHRCTIGDCRRLYGACCRGEPGVCSDCYAEYSYHERTSTSR